MPAIVYCSWFFGPQGLLSNMKMTSLYTAPVYNATFSLRTDNSTTDFLVDFEPQGFSSINVASDSSDGPGTVNANDSMQFFKILAERTRVVFVGPENSEVGFVRARTLNCIDCFCNHPLVSTREQTSQKSKHRMVGLEAQPHGDKEIVSFDFSGSSPSPELETSQTTITTTPVPETLQPPVVFEITAETTRSPI